MSSEHAHSSHESPAKPASALAEEGAALLEAKVLKKVHILSSLRKTSRENN